MACVSNECIHSFWMIILILRLHLPLVIPPRENSVTSKQTQWELLLEGPEHFFSLWLTIQEPFGDGPQISQWREAESWCAVVLNCEKVNCVKEEPKPIWFSDITFNSICGLLCIRAQAKTWGIRRKSLPPQKPCSVTSESHPHSHSPRSPSYTELWDLLGIRLFFTFSPLLFYFL